MISRLIFALYLLVLGVNTAGAVAEPSPQAMIEETSQQMVQALRQNRTVLQADPTKIYGLINQIVVPRFDFEIMSQWVLGKHWRDATPAQRQQFIEQFRTLLVRSYGGAILEYSDEDIVFPPSPKPAADAKETTVHSEVRTKNGGQPVTINYNLRRNGQGEWKVYDVAVDNVSIVINYRSTFNNQIRNQGSIDAVIADLRERNTKGSK